MWIVFMLKYNKHKLIYLHHHMKSCYDLIFKLISSKLNMICWAPEEFTIPNIHNLLIMELNVAFVFNPSAARLLK